MNASATKKGIGRRKGRNLQNNYNLSEESELQKSMLKTDDDDVVSCQCGFSLNVIKGIHELLASSLLVVPRVTFMPVLNSYQ